MIKYSKSFTDILSIKKDFMDFNTRELLKVKRINKFYSKQKIRKNCKICFKKLKEPAITSFDIDYIFCNNCNHLNGKYEDSKKYHEYLYTGVKNISHFVKMYTKNFDQILKKIHNPKVKFLKEVVKEKINLLDYGSGGGHFVKACLNHKINAWGIEANVNLHNFAKTKIHNRSLLSSENDLKNKTKELNINCMSLIFVLEHLPDVHYIFKFFKKSKLKYLYIAVPMVSPTIFFENVFPKVYPRHLGAEHNHLFTKESIAYLKKKYKFKIIGEWWFGTDIEDLYRSLLLTDNSKKIFSKNLRKKQINKFFFKVIDKLQSVLDREQLSSELHFVIKK